MKLKGKNFEFDFSSKTYIMGILNVTPDSFSDGGLFFQKKTAIDRALQMEDEGADIIDIGGESTRPGSERVTAREEIGRTVPVVTELAKKLRIPLSIDTYKSTVANAALSAGAALVNDISGLRFDPKMPKIVAKHQAPVVIMHIKGTPQNMQKKPAYQALIPEILHYLQMGIDIARKAGIAEEKIVIDPGIGFGKTVEHNLEIIKRLNEFTGLEKPILFGPSRKSFLGRVLDDLPVNQRLEGTSAAVAIGIINGANIIRVHDIKEMVMVARIADAIKRSC
ncbi:dihydropteroate synthase [bacterium]|nr:MAG: dihydropteroate synthase [bacterium]